MNIQDQRLFEQIYKQCFSAGGLYLMSRYQIDFSTAEDITNHTFMKLFAKWDRIEPHNSAVLISWFYKALNYTAQDYIKKQLRQPSTRTLPISECDLSDNGTEACALNLEYDYQLLLERIHSELSEKEWLLFSAIYVIQLPQEVILCRFGLTPNAFYLRKKRLKKKLVKFLNNSMSS